MPVPASNRSNPFDAPPLPRAVEQVITKIRKIASEPENLEILAELDPSEQEQFIIDSILSMVQPEAQTYDNNA